MMIYSHQHDEGESLSEHITMKAGSISCLVARELLWLATFYPGVFTILRSLEENFNHSIKAAEVADAIAVKMQLSSLDRQILCRGMLTHDIGKMYWPAELHTKRYLHHDEWVIIRFHSVAGHRYLMLNQYPEICARIALKHHERIDGSGYPQGLGFGELQVTERIAAVADCFEALTAPRPYRKANFTPLKAAEIMVNERHKYDPEALSSLQYLIEKGTVFCGKALVP